MADRSLPPFGDGQRVDAAIRLQAADAGSQEQDIRPERGAGLRRRREGEAARHPERLCDEAQSRVPQRRRAPVEYAIRLGLWQVDGCCKADHRRAGLVPALTLLDQIPIACRGGPLWPPQTALAYIGATLRGRPY